MESWRDSFINQPIPVLFMPKRKHNFSIEDAIWKKFKMLCVAKDKTATEIIETFITREVEKYEKSQKKS